MGEAGDEARENHSFVPSVSHPKHLSLATLHIASNAKGVNRHVESKAK